MESLRLPLNTFKEDIFEYLKVQHELYYIVLPLYKFGPLYNSFIHVQAKLLAVGPDSKSIIIDNLNLLYNQTPFERVIIDLGYLKYFRIISTRYDFFSKLMVPSPP